MFRIFSFVALIGLCACALPRGAPIKSEIVPSGDSERASNIHIQDVTRGSIDLIQEWPATGWRGHFNWPQATGGDAGQVIRAGDRLDLTVWDSQDNSLLTSQPERQTPMQSLTVSPAGTVFVPYVGEVDVTGLSPDAARARIQTDMTAIAADVQVQLAHVPGRKNSVDLVSGVVNPGRYPLEGRDETILSVIARGGGIPAGNDYPLVRLVRGGATYEMPGQVLLSTPSRNVVVQGGDLVVVDRDLRFFTVFGATEQEEIVYFQKEHITALEALTMVGGIKDGRANPKGLLVLRRYDQADPQKGRAKQDVVFVVDLTSPDGLFAARSFEIMPQDTIVATESAVKPAQAVIALLGSAFAITNVFE